MQRLFRTIWPALLWPVFICFLLLLPGQHVPNESLFPLPHADKLVHAFIFFVLTIIWFKTAEYRNLLTLSTQIILSLAAITYGLLLEKMQQLTGRDWDVWDGVANTAGVLIAVILLRKRK